MHNENNHPIHWSEAHQTVQGEGNMVFRHRWAYNTCMKSWWGSYWLIWQLCQRAYTIVNCLVMCHHWHHWCCHLWTVLLSTGLIIETSYFAHICTCAPSICTWISEYNLYFLNGSHFSSVLHVALLTTWFSLEPSYVAQLCTCTGAIHTQEMMQLWTIFLKW